VDEQADGPAHGLPKHEVGQARVLLPRPDGAEEGKEVNDGSVEVGHEGTEAVGAAVKQTNPDCTRKTTVDWNVQLMSLS
jgi:hypothetical protein